MAWSGRTDYIPEEKDRNGKPGFFKIMLSNIMIMNG
jgi:hypothetical protein